MKTNIKKKYKFQSEIKKLLHIMIHSLYSNKEIFIRELISNASDAIDKLKFKYISKPEKYINNKKMYIRIKINKKKKKISIQDNGIGMTKKETIKNLGTIAKSGTKKFISSMKKKKKNNKLIGKFGVGFYSSFIVSKLVQVKTKKSLKKKKKPILWESKGKGKYSISYTKKKKYGTKVTLKIKKKEKIFLESWKIKNIIKKYSDHISTPIEIYKYDEKNKKYFWEKINKAKSLWTLNKNKITKKQYKNFYKYISNDNLNPMIWIHNKIEGNITYISLLYIPKKYNINIWNKKNKNGLKLYINRIYIMNNAKIFIPNYLRFIKGILDSQNLPLNISREILQNNNIVNKIKINLTKKILNMLKELTNKKKKYEKFWKEFGIILKEGPAEDLENKKKICNLLRFASFKNKTEKQNLSFKKYIKNMQKNQKKIFFFTCDNYKIGIKSPHLEIFKKKNIDVLILSDKIDEWMMNNIKEIKGIKLQSISKLNNTLKNIINENNITNNKKNKKFIKKIKKILKNKIKNVYLSKRLTKTPAIVISDDKDISTQMSKLFIAAGQNIKPLKYIFEINIKHKIIKYIKNINNIKIFKKWIKILFYQALLMERGTLENPNKYIKNINKLLILNYIK